eukprot:Nk52_evm33s239 gene=Nk52_evmTU33s239
MRRVGWDRICKGVLFDYPKDTLVMRSKMYRKRTGVRYRMQKGFLAVSLSLIFLFQSISEIQAYGGGYDWTYDQEASGIPYSPQLWYINYSACGNRQVSEKQSPVDLPLQATTDLSLTEIDLTSYIPTIGTLVNNGFAFEFKLLDDSFTVQGGPLGSAVYRLSHVYGRWHSNDQERGAEHTVQGEEFPLELQFVHFNDAYSTYDNAKNQANGLFILSSLFKASVYPNTAFDKILAAIPQVKYNQTSFNTSTKVDLLELIWPGGLSTEKLSNYYTYKGSGTVPPCTENVLWVFSGQYNTISYQQLLIVDSLRAKTSGRSLLSHNHRPIQQLNGREVQKSFAGVFSSTGAVSTANISLVFFASILMLVL